MLGKIKICYSIETIENINKYREFPLTIRNNDDLILEILKNYI